jgi:RNA polymerase sigma-70 factor (ECF subfamily)
MPIVEGGEDFDIFSVLLLRQGNVEDNMVKKQVRTDIRRMIDRLPHEQREVLLMRHYMDMSFKEIADTTNVSINTALGRMRYALINMRKMIEKKSMTVYV